MSAAKLVAAAVSGASIVSVRDCGGKAASDGSGVGGGSLCRSVDGSVGRSVGGSGSSIGSGVIWPIY